MIRALAAEAAVNVKAPVALFKAELEGEHRVRIVLFYGKLQNVRMLRYFAERVKIAENKVGDDAVFGAVFKACVGCNDIVAVVRRFAQSEKIACADYIAFMSVHGRPPIMNFAFIIGYNIIYCVKFKARL